MPLEKPFLSRTKVNSSRLGQLVQLPVNSLPLLMIIINKVFLSKEKGCRAQKHPREWCRAQHNIGAVRNIRLVMCAKCYREHDNKNIVTPSQELGTIHKKHLDLIFSHKTNYINQNNILKITIHRKF